jgi:hypothetical protein
LIQTWLKIKLSSNIVAFITLINQQADNEKNIFNGNLLNENVKIYNFENDHIFSKIKIITINNLDYESITQKASYIA